MREAVDCGRRARPLPRSTLDLVSASLYRAAWSILDCARRTSTFLSCAFREQEDDQAALPTLLIVRAPGARDQHGVIPPSQLSPFTSISIPGDVARCPVPDFGHAPAMQIMSSHATPYANIEDSPRARKVFLSETSTTRAHLCMDLPRRPCMSDAPDKENVPGCSPLSFFPLSPIEWAESQADQSSASVTAPLAVAQECLL